MHQDKGKKWDPNSKPMILVGYELGSKAYRLWNPHTHSIIVSTTVHFDESILLNKPAKPPVSQPVVPLPTSIPEPAYVTIEPDWFFGEPKFHTSHPPVAPAQQPQLAPIQASSTPSSSSQSSLSPPASRPPIPPSHITAEPSHSPPPSSPSPNLDHTQPPPKPTTRKSTHTTKPVVRY